MSKKKSLQEYKLSQGSNVEHIKICDNLLQIVGIYLFKYKLVKVLKLISNIFNRHLNAFLDSIITNLLLQGA